ncbi:MAG: amidohydrolase family protein [Acaryochloridaceae cyanobacterium RL_2_7]|nr:amidohydrolase family protein [Acaryochloridaceae cyanobacterium RL_2_7]
MNPEQPEADAIAIQNGKIIAIGSEEAVLEQVGDDFQTVDLQGRMVMPGFQDPHLHALEAGLNENLCIVSQFADLETYRNELQDCAEQQPESEWVRASGVNMPNLLGQAQLDQEQLPIDILDAAIPIVPLLFWMILVMVLG